jgi:hypothetical protein
MSIPLRAITDAAGVAVSYLRLPFDDCRCYVSSQKKQREARQ